MELRTRRRKAQDEVAIPVEHFNEPVAVGFGDIDALPIRRYRHPDGAIDIGDGKLVGRWVVDVLRDRIGQHLRQWLRPGEVAEKEVADAGEHQEQQQQEEQQ